MINFREATLLDIENIMELEKVCFNKYTQESSEIYLERIEAFSEGFIILENENKFAGAISSEIWQYASKIEHNTFMLGHSIKKQLKLTGDELYISSIGVFPEYRQNGFGNQLFKALIDNIKLKFPNVIYGILLLNEEWKFAQKIYIKNGFENCKILKNFFTAENGTKTNGIVMRKKRL
jgi:ribosomal-protein-alanine N-acetyltransferase